MIPGIGDVHRSIRTDRDTPRLIEGALRSVSGGDIGKTAPFLEKGSIGCDMQDAVIARICYIKITVQTIGDGARRIQPEWWITV